MKTIEGWRGIGALCMVAAGWCVTGSALAQQTESAAAAGAQGAPPPLASEIGHATLDWLDLQRSGAQAAPPLTMLGDEAGLAYQRYMESFKTKIPVSFGSSVGAGGNLLRVDYTNMSGAQQN